MRGMTGTTARRPRRSGVACRLDRIRSWIGIPVLILVAGYGAVQLNRSPLGQSLLHGAADRMVQGTGLLGLTIADITV